MKHTDQGKEDQDLEIGDPCQGRDQDMGYGNPDQKTEDPDQGIEDSHLGNADPNQWQEGSKYLNQRKKVIGQENPDLEKEDLDQGIESLGKESPDLEKERKEDLWVDQRKEDPNQEIKGKGSDLGKNSSSCFKNNNSIADVHLTQAQVHTTYTANNVG